MLTLGIFFLRLSTDLNGHRRRPLIRRTLTHRHSAFVLCHGLQEIRATSHHIKRADPDHCFRPIGYVFRSPEAFVDGEKRSLGWCLQLRVVDRLLESLTHSPVL